MTAADPSPAGPRPLAPASAAAVDPAVNLAAALVRHIGATSMLDLEQMRLATVTALRRDPDIEIVDVDRVALGSECSIAAAYDPNVRPARILVASDAPDGRRRFSLLHEYGHHLCSRVDDVVDAFWAAPDGGRALEERVCDAFAAAVLLPPDRTAAAFTHGVTAAQVVRFTEAETASRQACMVTAAQALPAAGAVMLLDTKAVATFTAHRTSGARVASGTQQLDPLLKSAAQGRSVRGRARLTFGSGSQGPEMLVDAVALDGGAMVVAVEHSAAWETFTVGLANDIVGVDGYCENCTQSFQSFTRTCDECGDPRCPNCGSCDCPAPPTVRGAQECTHCHLVQPPSMYKPGSERCADCR